MIRTLTVIGILVLIIVFLAMAYGFFRTWKTGRSENHARFIAGSIPLELPEGQWNGYVDELGDVSWKGKKFLNGGQGINVFVKEGTRREAYPFAFSERQSIGERDKKVITLDYNQKENPLWLRFIVDEMVSVGENKFLGIVYIKLIPSFPFRMGYFRLEK